MPSGIQWISGLSRGVATRVALRLFVVLLCVLITLLMAILNFVSSYSDFMFGYLSLLFPIIHRFIMLRCHLFSLRSSSRGTTVQR